MIAFFYGLFMDDDLLRSMGANPRPVGIARVRDRQLRIGARATLVDAPGAWVEGTVTELSESEVASLYSGQSLAGYEPIDVIARLRDGSTVDATTYVLPESAIGEATNLEYAEKLRALAARLGLDPTYVASI